MSAPTPIFRPPGARAFTLIELLVSMVVLTLLLVLVVQMVNSALAVTNNSTRHMTADGQARGAFDRMAADFAQIVKRQDVDYFFQKNGSGTTTGADDQMAFYSETTGYYPNLSPAPSAAQKGNASLVGYCIRNNTTAARNDPTYGKRQLVRLSKAMLWNGVGTTPPAMTYLPQTLPGVWPFVFPGATGTQSTTGSMGDPNAATDPDFQVIGDQVFRMEISYLVHYPATPATATASATAPHAQLQDVPCNPASTATFPAGSTTLTPASLPTAYNGLRDVVAVVVSLAVLDDTSRVTVQPGDLDAAAGLLADVGSSTAANTPLPLTPVALASTPAKLWQQQIDGNTLSKANTASHGPLPPAAASQVRVYERYFYLGNAQ